MVSVPSALRVIALVLVYVSLLVGCASTPPQQEALPTIADRLVAKDFTQIIAQVEELDPTSTVLRMPRPIGFLGSFDAALREEFLIVGYSIEYLDYELNLEDPVISHTLTRSKKDDGEVLVYTVSADKIQFRRGYEVDADGLIQPITTMQVKGIDSEILRQDDTIFDAVADSPENDAGSDDAGITVADRLPDPIGEELIVIPPVVDVPAELSEAVDLQNMRIVNESLLTFENQSLVMGESNKNRVRELITEFNSRSDVFSLYGCAGQDQISWTEEFSELALGRTDRVRSELLYAGIPGDKILIEQCDGDAAESGPELPEDSVLLLLNRRNAQ